MNYLIRVDGEGYRHVYRIESETETHYTVTVPLFVCFGSTFSHWGRKKDITKKWVASRGLEAMDKELAKKYDAIQKDDNCGMLFDE